MDACDRSRVPFGKREESLKFSCLFKKFVGLGRHRPSKPLAITTSIIYVHEFRTSDKVLVVFVTKVGI
jgi:hypothetical protein